VSEWREPPSESGGETKRIYKTKAEKRGEKENKKIGQVMAKATTRSENK
jgi:hypothetical protein